jgi:GAF domain-containing protein
LTVCVENVIVSPACESPPLVPARHCVGVAWVGRTDSQLSAQSREQWLARTFVQVADTLVDDFVVDEFAATVAQRCAELLDDGSDVALMLHDAGELKPLAASTPRARMLELFEVQNHEGPCFDCFTSGQPLIGQRLIGGNPPWPAFGDFAYSLGYRVAHAVPMCLRSEAIGVLTILQTHEDGLPDAELQLIHALVDAATIALLQHRARNRATDLAQQLQEALDSRVVIEQAKGMLSVHLDRDVQDAFELLRKFARRTNKPIAQVAAEVVTGNLTAQHLQEADGPSL